MGSFWRFILLKAVQMVVTLVVILTIVFFMFELLPTRPWDLLRTIPNFNPQQIHAQARLFGFEDANGHQLAWWERYPIYLTNMFTFNFGLSFSRGTPVIGELAERLPRTLLLFGLATLISYAIGIIVGAFIAWRRGGVADATTVVSSLVFYNMPSFWIGLIFLFLFASSLSPLNPIWGGSQATPPFPLGGFYDDVRGPPIYILNVLWHIALPLLVLVLIELAFTILLMRTAMLDAMSEAYVLTAQAKGLKERDVMFRHAARNAMLPVVTAFILSLVFVISGGVVIEQVFSFQGIGQLYINSLQLLDFPVMEATIFIIALLVVLGNFVADMVYGYLDPRIR